MQGLVRKGGAVLVHAWPYIVASKAPLLSQPCATLRRFNTAFS